MKKLLLAVWLAVTLAVPAFGADSITGFTLSAPTSTTLYARWTNALTAADYDSLTIVRSDSTCIKVVGTSATTIDDTYTTITGLAPHTQYICYIRGALTAGGYRVSNLDTLYTAWPNVEMFNNILSSTTMSGARSWRASNIFYDSLYVGTDAGLDSTYAYWGKAYTAIQAYVDGHADSCKVKLLIFNGHSEETNPLRETTATNTGQWNYYLAASDSLDITLKGWTQPHLLNMDLSDHFYIRADGQANNGAATKVFIRLYRRDD